MLKWKLLSKADWAILLEELPSSPIHERERPLRRKKWRNMMRKPRLRMMVIVSLQMTLASAVRTVIAHHRLHLIVTIPRRDTVRLPYVLNFQKTTSEDGWHQGQNMIFHPICLVQKNWNEMENNSNNSRSSLMSAHWRRPKRKGEEQQEQKSQMLSCQFPPIVDEQRVGATSLKTYDDRILYYRKTMFHIRSILKIQIE